MKLFENPQNFRSLVLLFFLCLSLNSCKKKQDDWIDLFNGKDLSGWKANENAESFKVVDGVIVANGNRSHLFYIGEVENADFKNFELKAEVMTHYLANSGIYFHTNYQDEGWPEKGYEVQINNTHKGGGDYREVKKTGSLYSIKNVYKAFARDSAWFTLHIRVVGMHVQVKVNDTLVVDYIEPAKPTRTGPPGQKMISSGTFALQGHDPESTVYFRSIKVRPIGKEAEEEPSTSPPVEPYSKIVELQTNHFPVIDMEVNTKAPFNIDSTLKVFYKSGINLGVIIEGGKIEKGHEEETLSNYIQQYSRYPVFTGLKINDQQIHEGVSAKTLEQFDYVIGEMASFQSKNGIISLNSDEKIPDTKSYMDDYVKGIVDFLGKRNVTIWAKPTVLPVSIASNYKTLWTKERMIAVIDAAKQNGIAIEINEELQLPSIEFVKLAKEKGCLFTCGNLNIADETEGFDYYLKIIKECSLVYKDIYIPGTIEPIR